MSVDEKTRAPRSRGLAGRLARGLAQALVPTERTILTREGWWYFGVMVVLLVTGLYQQVNLILLVATLAAGPFLTSYIGSRAFLRRLSVVRRAPPYVFSGDPLIVDYTLENGRRWTAALALFMEDSLVPTDRTAAASALSPRVFFPRVAGQGRARTRWLGTSPRRGAYRFRDLTLGTRAPFGLIERRVTILLDDELVAYPRIGQLTRRWFQLQRQASENRMGQRHDRSSQQEEYHGLRDYRSGDSPRWIHWRTSARRGELMVKEFEQQNEQELALLIDPWLPRTKVASELREAMEQAISFAATVCLESCRRPGRRLVLGWTGASPGICQGQASVKLLHELLQQLAVLRPATEGTLAELIDTLPAPSLRDSLLIIVSTRPLQLAEEAERSKRLAGTAARSLLARAIVLNAAQGELTELIQDAGSSSRNLLEQRVSSADQERLTSQDQRRRGLTSADDGKGVAVKSYLIYRASSYVMLTVSVMILCGDTTDSRLNWLLPMVTAAAGIVAFLTVDQNRGWGLPRDLANFLAVGTLGVLYLECRADPNQIIACLGHWLIYLQLIKYFLPKTAQDDWFLFGLGLTEVLIGSVTNQGDMVGAWLLFWAMLAVWVLGLFFLHREARRFQDEATAIALPSRIAKDDPYFGLFDVPYLAASLRVLSLTLLLGGFFFLLLPRQAGATRARSSSTMSKHLTGFDEEVALGQLGEILENDSVVMSVEFADEDRKAIRPVGEPLWRGVTLIHYENGRWRRLRHHSLQTIVAMSSFHNRRGPNRRELIRQIIKLEPNDSATLFGIRPVLEAVGSSRLNPYMDPVDGTIYRAETRGGYDYEILSDVDPDGPQESEMVPSDTAVQSLREMPEDLRARFREIALPVIRDIQGEGLAATRARARALEGYLRESGLFSYTLQMDVVDRRMDPVEDFLVNRKQGHCEYFASGLALLLRSVDVPARMVNGFKGGDWNELTQSMNVRQKHAHSWVEAYVGQDEHNRPRWVTLDPTPGLERDASVARVGGLAGNVRSVTDMIRYVWVFYILGYDSNRQNRLLYAPLKSAILAVREGYATLWALAKRGFARLFDFQNLASFVSVKGFVVSFLVLSLMVSLVKLAAWLGRRALQWWRGTTDDSSGLTAGILFYRRLAQLLAPYDLERTTAETQNEFALRATRFLTGQGMQTLPVADVPRKVVDAYYRVRFGHRDLDPESLRELEESLDLLEHRLSDPLPEG